MLPVLSRPCSEALPTVPAPWLDPGAAIRAKRKAEAPRSTSASKLRCTCRGRARDPVPAAPLLCSAMLVVQDSELARRAGAERDSTGGFDSSDFRTRLAWHPGRRISPSLRHEAAERRRRAAESSTGAPGTAPSQAAGGGLGLRNWSWAKCCQSSRVLALRPCLPCPRLGWTQALPLEPASVPKSKTQSRGPKKHLRKQAPLHL